MHKLVVNSFYFLPLSGKLSRDSIVKKCWNPKLSYIILFIGLLYSISKNQALKIKNDVNFSHIF